MTWIDIIIDAFSTKTPHALCCLGQNVLLTWAIGIANVVIGICYLCWPVLLHWLVSDITKISGKSTLVIRSLQAFVLFCGFSHFTLAVMLRYGYHWVEMLMACATALVSMVGVGALYTGIKELRMMYSQRISVIDVLEKRGEIKALETINDWIEKNE